jgi:hypothetical protein
MRDEVKCAVTTQQIPNPKVTVMKKNRSLSIRPLRVRRNGFALVITLSLMVLLTLLAVGLLTLSSVSLRSSTQGNAMAVARSNARLAMLLGLGELQKATGTDRAITAPAALLSERFPQGITGTWSAWDAKQESFEREESDKKFTGWLVSSPTPERLLDPSLPPYVPADTTGAAVLLGNGSLGKRADRLKDDQRIALQPSQLALASQPGGYAWAVIDENIKSRVDLYRNPSEKKPWTNVARAGSPPTDGVTTLQGWSRFKVRDVDEGKLATLDTVPLNTLVAPDDAAIYDPDITVFSNSLMTDPVNGGLKKDLSLLSSRALNSTENSARLYKFSGAITDTIPADPALSLLTNYHQLYKRLGVRDGVLRPSAYQVAARLPARHAPYTTDGTTFKAARAVPAEPVLVPSIVRVDVIFSMITRKSHGGWVGFYGSGRPYLLHMQYLPVVTIHNPYSVPLVFEGMKVSFKNLPVGFNFIVDGQPLSTRLVALNQMYVSYAGNDSTSKDFGINLKAATGSSSATLMLEPGQTKLFGMPKVPATWTWFQESPGTGVDGGTLFDWRNDKGDRGTANFDMTPTMITPPQGGGAGFDIDWINPEPLQTPKGLEVSKGRGMVSLIGNETLGVQFGPYMSTASNGSFSVAIDLLKNGAEVKAGAIEVKYGDQNRLNELLQKGTSVRFPDRRTFPETFPKPGVDPGINTGSIYEEGDRPLKDYVKSKQFMIFSLAAKTTQESFIPAKTLLTGNPSTNVAIIDLTKGKDPEGGVPLEMVMMPIRNGSAAIEENRALQEGYFFGGNGSLRGTPRATFYEFPVMPLQSLAQFRHANLASSGFMPFTLYTVGESWAHPQIGTGLTRQNWTDRSVMLDHAYLANKALWDQYFLSTVADQTGPAFGTTTRTFDKVLTEFFESDKPLLNARFKPYQPGGRTTPPQLKQTTAGNPAYQQLAAYLMLAGGFNINSTSVDAWKTVLAALDDAEIETVLGAEAAATGRFALLRVRRPAEKAIDGAPIVTRQSRWQGYRRLTEEQIEQLAEQIVAEVRARGPFLSMADFVNRGIGAESETTIKGALQAAIDRVKTINANVEIDGKELAAADVTANGYKSVLAGTGNNATYAPGMISQGDVLSLIGSRISVRGDTFRIRGYGEARDPGGRRVLATAWCEAVVQRVPDFVDAANSATTAFTELNPINRKFGRRYQIVAFRWLNPGEV